MMRREERDPGWGFKKKEDIWDCTHCGKYFHQFGYFQQHMLRQHKVHPRECRKQDTAPTKASQHRARPKRPNAEGNRRTHKVKSVIVGGKEVDTRKVVARDDKVSRILSKMTNPPVITLQVSPLPSGTPSPATTPRPQFSPTASSPEMHNSPHTPDPELFPEGTPSPLPSEDVPQTAPEKHHAPSTTSRPPPAAGTLPPPTVLAQPTSGETEVRRPVQVPPPPVAAPRYIRNGPPQSSAGAEVSNLRKEAYNLGLMTTAENELHQLDHGIIYRQVVEAAHFPDGRVYTTRYNEYLLPGNVAFNRPQWQVGYARSTTGFKNGL